MKRRWTRRVPTLTLFALLLASVPGAAGPFNNGIGSAMYYGPYTGGHIYSYNVAYGYGLSYNFADSWRVDPLAYPGGVYYHNSYPLWQRLRERRAGEAAGADAAGPVPADLGALRAVPTDPASAVVRVTVPAGAAVWFEGQRTEQGGTARTFHSPPLPPGKSFVYTVRARWGDAGGEVEQFQAVSVRAGAEAAVRFPAPRP